MASAMDLSEWDNDPRLFLFTSLTAGSSHIITATSRMETILKANKIPFQAIDTATDGQARRLFGRRAGKSTVTDKPRKIPVLVKEGYVIGDLEEVEEWNEFGELKENIGPLPAPGAAPAAKPGQIGSLSGPIAPSSTSTPAPQATTTRTAAPSTAQSTSTNIPMRQVAAEAASTGAARKGPTPGVDDSKLRPLPGGAPLKDPGKEKEIPALSGLEAADRATKPETMNTSAADKQQSIRTAVDTTTLAGDGTDANSAVEAQQVEAQVPPKREHQPAPSSITEASKTVSPEAILEGDSTVAAGVDESTATPDKDAGLAAQKHRGSSVSEASKDEIKEVERETAIPEDTEEQSDDDTVPGKSESVEGKQSEGGKKPQEGESAKAEEAGVSVED